MGKYRKRPVVIDAIQWTGKNLGDVLGFMGVIHVEGGELKIVTPEGIMTASIDDWVIKGVKGEFYPCKPDIFEATYEPVEEDR